jgi:hypothetical protein
MTGLLLTKTERDARRNGKRSRLLRFLRQELWSTAEILGSVMEIRARQAIHRSLAGFEADGLIRRHGIEQLGGQLTLWGITAHGQGMAFDPENEQPVSAYFEPSKVSPSHVAHALALQRLRIAAEAEGWSEWTNGDRLGPLAGGAKRPDALAKMPSGQRVAIEIERHIKTKKRYEAILASCLQAIRRGEFAAVVWVCPTPDLARRLSAIVLGIQAVPIGGQRVPVDPERHHPRLVFASAKDWLPAAQRTAERT